MDFIEIKDDDYLAECVNGIYFDNWIIHNWRNFMLTHYNQLESKEDNTIPINDTSFTVGNDFIELYDGVFESEPCTNIVPIIEGRLTTLFMTSVIKLDSAKIKGKMRIRNTSEPALLTEYEISLNEAAIRMTIGLKIHGDGLIYDHCTYEFYDIDLLFEYREKSKMVSVFEKIADENKRKLIERYILEYVLKDLCIAIEDYQQTQLSIKQTVSELCGNDYGLRCKLKIHNKALHLAFRNLMNEIISKTIQLVQEDTPKLYIKEILGLLNEGNIKTEVKLYKSFISNFNSLAMVKDKEVIIASENDTVTLHVPVVFNKLILHYNEVNKDGTDNLNSGEYGQVQNFKTDSAYIIISMKKIEKRKAEFKLKSLRIMNIVASSKHKVKMSMDYLVSSAIEEMLKPHLEKSLKSEDLHRLAIYPDIEVSDSSEEEDEEED